MTAVTETQHAQDAERVETAARPKGFELFGEMGLVGVLALAGCVVLVGWIAAVAAGVAHMRRHLWGYGDSVADYAGLFRDSLRGNWPAALASVAVGFLLWANAAWVSAGAVPGGSGLLAALGVVAAAVWAVCVSAAAAWSSPEGEATVAGVRGWWALLASAGRTCLDDLVGTLLLLVSLGLGILLVWMFIPLFIVVPGLWVLAAVGVEFRRHTRAATR